MSDKHLLCTPQQVREDVAELTDELLILRDHRKESFVWGEDALKVKHHMNVESLQRLQRLALKGVRMKGKP